MLVGIAVGVVSGAAASDANSDTPGSVIHTLYGDVQGELDDSGAIEVFHGVPFGAAMVGDLRWTPPRPPTPWAGIRNTSMNAPACAYRALHPCTSLVPALCQRSGFISVLWTDLERPGAILVDCLPTSVHAVVVPILYAAVVCVHVCASAHWGVCHVNRSHQMQDRAC